MLAFPVVSRATQRLDVLCIGAHCDDIEIGCGGTLLAMQQHHARVRVHWLILSSDAQRRGEAKRSAEAFIRPAARGEFQVHDLCDGRLPSSLAQVKDLLEGFRRIVEPDCVLTHHGGDRHQDHALLSAVTWQTFRNHAIWEYEIPKYDGDLVTPNVYVPLPADLARRKVEFIVKTYSSQRGKSWFRSDNLLALMHLRGMECRADSGFAEAFHGRKLVFTPTVQAPAQKRAPKQPTQRSGR